MAFSPILIKSTALEVFSFFLSADDDDVNCLEGLFGDRVCSGLLVGLCPFAPLRSVAL